MASEGFESARKRIIRNLGNGNDIDSPGVGGVVSTYTTVSNQGGQLKFLCLTHKNPGGLAIAKL
jgi:anti-sigma B factor antagonist